MMKDIIGFIFWGIACIVVGIWNLSIGTTLNTILGNVALVMAAICVVCLSIELRWPMEAIHQK